MRIRKICRWVWKFAAVRCLWDEGSKVVAAIRAFTAVWPLVLPLPPTSIFLTFTFSGGRPSIGAVSCWVS